MCGRYTLITSSARLATLFDLPEPPRLAPRYNIAPTQPVAVVRRLARDPQRRFDHLLWGLVPPWADDPAVGNRLINARAESAATRPAFRTAFRRRRCLLPASGFYEWRKGGKGGSPAKQPYHITPKSGDPFAFAGLWELWQGANGSELETCTILTTEANALIQPIHDRMPVIVPPEHYDLWLDPAVEEVEPLQAILKPYPAQAMQTTPVGTYVNSPKHEDPRCLEPPQEAGTLFGEEG